MQTAEQQLHSKAGELKQHQDLVAQQDSDLLQLRQELAQSAAACDQLHADAGAAAEREGVLEAQAAEREGVLEAQAGRQQDERSNARKQLAGEICSHAFCSSSARL